MCKVLSSSLVREYYSQHIQAMDAICFLTYRCSSRCKACNIWKRNQWDHSHELNFKQWKIVLDNLKHGGIKTLEIFGGDALLRKDLLIKIVQYCSDIKIKTFFPTNSSLLDEKTLKELVQAGLGTIYFSLDGINSEHDNIRGKENAFQKVKEAITQVGKIRNNNKPNIIIITTISNMNFTNFEKIIKFAKSLPVDAIYPRAIVEFSEHNINHSSINGILPEPYFQPTDGDSHLLDNEEFKSFVSKLKKLKRAYKKDNIYIDSMAIDLLDMDSHMGERKHKKCLPCSTVTIIDPTGNILPCPMFHNYDLGNTQHQPIKEIWGNDKHRQFIHKQRNNKIQICKNYNLKEYYPSFRDMSLYYFKKALKLI